MAECAAQHAFHAPCEPHTPTRSLAANSNAHSQAGTHLRKIDIGDLVGAGAIAAEAAVIVTAAAERLHTIGSASAVPVPHLRPPVSCRTTSTTVVAWDKITTKRMTTAAHVGTRAICCAALSHPRLPARGDGTRADAGNLPARERRDHAGLDWRGGRGW